MSQKLERKVILALAKLLKNESVLVKRWRIVGQVVTIVGWALIAYTAISYLDRPMLPRGYLLLAILGGVCASVGLWFTSFAAQWPVIAQFLDRQAIAIRANESS